MRFALLFPRLCLGFFSLLALLISVRMTDILQELYTSFGEGLAQNRMQQAMPVLGKWKMICVMNCYTFIVLTSISETHAKNLEPWTTILKQQPCHWWRRCKCRACHPSMRARIAVATYSTQCLLSTAHRTILGQRIACWNPRQLKLILSEVGCIPREWKPFNKKALDPEFFEPIVIWDVPSVMPTSRNNIWRYEDGP